MIGNGQFYFVRNYGQVVSLLLLFFGLGVIFLQTMSEYCQSINKYVDGDPGSFRFLLYLVALFLFFCFFFLFCFIGCCWLLLLLLLLLFLLCFLFQVNRFCFRYGPPCSSLYMDSVSMILGTLSDRK